MANDSKTQLNVKAKIEEKLAQYFGVTPSDASIDQMYKAISMTVVDQLLEKKERVPVANICNRHFWRYQILFRTLMISAARAL